jgi:predicted transcriptional regulator of viral defense system
MPKSKIHILTAIKGLERPIFTTRQAAAFCRGSLSNTIQALNHLEKQGVITKIARGIWGFEAGRNKISPYDVISYLLPSHRAYVSFVSALHLHGIIEQIPQSITLASTEHTKTIHTNSGTFFIHRIAPSFFKGFDWYKGDGSFLIAEQEKALIDCLYLSARKKKQFGHFPELHFPASFSFVKAKRWARQIPYTKIRSSVLKKLEALKAKVHNSIAIS